jgi:hypothetical protein
MSNTPRTTRETDRFFQIRTRHRPMGGAGMEIDPSSKRLWTFESFDAC